VNTVLRSLELAPGDEVVTTNHEYNACKNALDFVAHRSGAKVIVVDIPLPIASEDAVVDAIDAALGPKARLLLIDHVTSPSALVMPLHVIAKRAHAKGVDVLVDGAHAPGMVPLSIAELGVAYYTANCHKWICAPKGAAMLFVRADKRASVRPLSISHGANSPRTDRSRFRLEHDWTGTDDPTAAICVKHAIDFMSGLLPGGFDEVMRKNRQLALDARALLCSELGQGAECPASMVGSMAVVRLPDRHGPLGSMLTIEPLQDRLFESHAIEVPIVPWPAPPRRFVRVSAQAYDDIAEYKYLADAVRIELGKEP
jgi:isopenicillin-N epimerase